MLHCRPVMSTLSWTADRSKQSHSLGVLIKHQWLQWLYFISECTNIFLMTSPSSSTAPPEHPVAHFIVLANSKRSRLLFASGYKTRRRKCSLANTRQPQKKRADSKGTAEWFYVNSYLSGASSVNKKMLMSGVSVCVCVRSCGSVRISHPSAFEPE